jgi:CCR4-NOT transcriptional regulation complex NOT5 subunit
MNSYYRPREIPSNVTKLVELNDTNDLRYILYIRHTGTKKDLFMYVAKETSVRFHGQYDIWSRQHIELHPRRHKIFAIANELSFYL